MARADNLVFDQNVLEWWVPQPMKMNLRPYTFVAILVSVSLSLLILRIWDWDEAGAMHVHNSLWLVQLTLFSTKMSLIDEYHSQWKLIYAHILALLFSWVSRYRCWFCEFDNSTSGRQTEQPFWPHHFADLLKKRSDSDGWTVEIRLFSWFFLFWRIAFLYLDHHQ